MLRIGPRAVDLGVKTKEVYTLKSLSLFFQKITCTLKQSSFLSTIHSVTVAYLELSVSSGV